MKFPCRELLLAARVLVVATIVAGPLCAQSQAEDLLPPETAIEAAVDHYIAARLKDEGVSPAPLADDANYIRRVTLDLAGRIPAPVEVQEFVASTEPDKRARLVDRLLASPDFDLHQRNELDTLLMPTRKDGPFREYLLRVIRENRPWPQVFREVLMAREEFPDEKPALAFLKARAANLDDLTNDTSRLFFGVSINCAKCHDHPLVLDWTQDHYFGMASFFNRTYLTKKNFLAERDEGLVKFKTTAGEEKQAQLMFLTGAVIEESPPPELSEEDKKARAARLKEDEERETPPEPPAYSRRRQLADIALRPENISYFSRSFVNRTWARLTGRGIVMPLDQMHSENRPSHPELLTWLARDAETHDFDLRRLMRGIVLSQAYGRSSRWDSAADRPSESLFAVASIRALSPMQYSLSLSLASTNPEQLAQRLSQSDQWPSHRQSLEGQAGGFANLIEVPGENFQVGVSEALLFSNNQRIQGDYLRDGGDKLIGVLKGITDRHQAVTTAYLSVYSRLPEPDEVELTTQYLAAREDRPLEAWQQVVWAMLTSGEFRFNY